MIRKSINKALLAAVFAAVLGFGSTAMACPNCKFANETESNRPKAYMYSILFMIGMPATIFTGFGISFYRMIRKSEQESLRQIAGAQMSGAESDSADAT